MNELILIVQISRLSTTALILIFCVKRPEIDEICRNLSWKGVNGWEFNKTQTTLLCNTIILRKAEVCPRKISHKFYKQSLFIFLQTVRPILIVSEKNVCMHDACNYKCITVWNSKCLKVWIKSHAYTVCLSNNSFTIVIKR